MAKLLAEEPDALMHARPDLWEPWRATAKATRPDRTKRHVPYLRRSETPKSRRTMKPVQFRMMAYPPSEGTLERFLYLQFETAVCHTAAP